MNRSLCRGMLSKPVQLLGRIKRVSLIMLLDVTCIDWDGMDRNGLNWSQASRYYIVFALNWNEKRWIHPRWPLDRRNDLFYISSYVDTHMIFGDRIHTRDPLRVRRIIRLSWCATPRFLRNLGRWSITIAHVWLITRDDNGAIKPGIMYNFVNMPYSIFFYKAFTKFTKLISS